LKKVEDARGEHKKRKPKEAVRSNQVFSRENKSAKQQKKIIKKNY